MAMLLHLLPMLVLALVLGGGLATVAAMRSSQVSRLLELQSPAYQDLLKAESEAPAIEQRRSA